VDGIKLEQVDAIALEQLDGFVRFRNEGTITPPTPRISRLRRNSASAPRAGSARPSAPPVATAVNALKINADSMAEVGE